MHHFNILKDATPKGLNSKGDIFSFCILILFDLKMLIETRVKLQNN